jgi:hypothetical protein
VKYVLLERKNGLWRILSQSDDYNEIAKVEHNAKNSTHLINTWLT